MEPQFTLLSVAIQWSFTSLDSGTSLSPVGGRNHTLLALRLSLTKVLDVQRLNMLVVSIKLILCRTLMKNKRYLAELCKVLFSFVRWVCLVASNSCDIYNTFRIHVAFSIIQTIGGDVARKIDCLNKPSWCVLCISGWLELRTEAGYEAMSMSNHQLRLHSWQHLQPLPINWSLLYYLILY